MKFRVARDEFADSVAWVARSLPSRPPVPVLGCVVLNVGETGLTVSGFDYEVSAQENLGAEVAEPGQVLVSGRLLADITKALPNKPVDVTLDGSRVAITCGSAKFSLPTMPVEDYPQLPDVPAITGTIITERASSSMPASSGPSSFSRLRATPRRSRNSAARFRSPARAYFKKPPSVRRGVDLPRSSSSGVTCTPDGRRTGARAEADVVADGAPCCAVATRGPAKSARANARADRTKARR